MELFARSEIADFLSKKGVKFQDGEPFSSKDVKFSFERYAAKDSTNKERRSSPRSSRSTPPIPTSSCSNSRIRVSRLCSTSARTRRSSSTKSAADEATHPVGPGPISSPPGTRASETLGEMGRFPRRGQNRDRACDVPLHQRPLRGGRRCCRGDIDTFRTWPSRTLSNFKAIRGSRCCSAAPRARRSSAMNNKKKPLDNLKVRQAIAYAIDRKAIIDGAMNGLGTPIGSHLTPNDPGYVDLTGEYPLRPRQGEGAAEGSERDDSRST